MVIPVSSKGTDSIIVSLCISFLTENPIWASMDKYLRTPLQELHHLPIIPRFDFCTFSDLLGVVCQGSTCSPYNLMKIILASFLWFFMDHANLLYGFGDTRVSGTSRLKKILDKIGGSVSNAIKTSTWNRWVQKDLIFSRFTVFNVFQIPKNKEKEINANVFLIFNTMLLI